MRTKKIKYLEGLRGISALVVFIDHLLVSVFNLSHIVKLYASINEIPYFPGVIKSLIIHLIILFTSANLAVWIFWLLSAYVISIRFFKNNNLNPDAILIGAFVKRYVRLFIPVLGSVLIAYTLMEFGLMYNKVTLTYNPANLLTASYYSFTPNILQALYSASFSTFFDFHGGIMYNSVLWTIQQEFFGSILVFSVFGIVRYNAKRYWIYLIIFILLIILKQYPLSIFIIGHTLCDYDFSFSDNRFVLFIKNIEYKIHRNTLLFFLFSFLCILFQYSIMNFVHITFVNGVIFFGFFVVYCCLRNDYYKKIFSSAIPYWFGKISFSLYLIHVPIICSFTCFIISRYNSFNGKLAAFLLTIIITLPLAQLFTSYIDNKTVIFSNKIADYFKRNTKNDDNNSSFG